MIAETIFSICIFLCSTIKFGYAAIAVHTSGAGALGITANVLGGLTGIVAFSYIGEPIKGWMRDRYPDMMGKRFGRMSRLVVHVRQRFGLAGIAFLTPVLFSIPVGVMVAQGIYRSRSSVVSSMCISCIFWAVVFFLPYYAICAQVSHWWASAHGY
jgi:hypothetical protein